MNRSNKSLENAGKAHFCAIIPDLIKRHHKLSAKITRGFQNMFA